MLSHFAETIFFPHVKFQSWNYFFYAKLIFSLTDYGFTGKLSN